MTALEKKAIDHCINMLKSITTVQVWQLVNRALEETKIPTTEQKKILDNLSNAMQLYVTNPANEAREWLTELKKD